MNFTTLRKLSFVLFFVLATVVANAAKIKGVVVDKDTKEPIVGATVIIAETSVGTSTDLDGNFELKVSGDQVTLIFSYIAYDKLELKLAVKDVKETITVELVPSSFAIDEVQVVGRRNMENETVLQGERKVSVTAIENIGAKEMSIKGLSNVEEGVKKMTGVTVESAGQIIVRGLGDRYSITTLNGQPIASPNPDNKLAPLNIFPSSAVKNITVSKVYSAASYADYSGAHIDISTKDQVGEDFFSFGFGIGGYFNTLGQDFYRMNSTSLFTTATLAQNVYDMSKTEIDNYVLENNIFDTDFSVASKTSLPAFDGSIGFGRTFDIGNQKLSVLGAANISSSQEAMFDSEYQVLEAGGEVSDSYTYDSYTTKLNTSALANIGMSLREEDRISYTLFFARNASDAYQIREGLTDNQGYVATSNSVTHIYKLLTNQIHGTHTLSDNWGVNWGAIHSVTSSEEPDRRQVLFLRDDATGDYMIYPDDISTMRFFGGLDESEVSGDLAFDYNFGDAHKLSFGASYKKKHREYQAVRFYYGGLYSIMNEVDGDDLFNTSSYLNQDNISNGEITLSRNMQPNDTYSAESSILAGFATVDLSLNENALLSLGLRYEDSKQYVEYYDTKYDSRSLNVPDFFPAVNFKYSFNDENQIRLAISRTVTRPSFVEMAPFTYQESYGSSQLRGNADLQNGYNNNVDIRYEAFLEGGDMVSLTGYFKQLIDPIERVQEDQYLQTFQNADEGMAAGFEVEYRKKLSELISFNVNGSFVYTNVKLSNVVATNYTNDERELQGASPYIVNADVVYSPKVNGKNTTFALLYNLQGPRIHAVGLNGQNDVMQRAYNKLNFIATYQLSEVVSLKAELENLLNAKEVYDQEIAETGENVIVKSQTPGMYGKIGVSFKF